MREAVSLFSAQISVFLMRLSGVGLVVMTVIISWQVFARYVLNQSPSWSEQSALLLLNWSVMAAAAAGVRQNFHIRVAFLAENAPSALRKPVRLAADGAVALVGLAFVLWGGELVVSTWPHAIPTLPVPRGVAYLPFPLAGALIVFFSIERIAATLSANGDDAEVQTWS